MNFKWFGEAEPEPENAAKTIIDRVQREQGVISQTLPIPDAHGAPPWPMTINQAKYAIQVHRGCRIEDCPRKRAARQVLIDAGKLRPRNDRTPRR